MRKENLETAKNLNFIFCGHPLNKKSVDEYELYGAFQNQGK